MKALLVGMRKFTSGKTGKDYTTLYIQYENKEVTGKACGDALVEGHELPESLVGKNVDLETDLRGRVLGVVAA